MVILTPILASPTAESSHVTAGQARDRSPLVIRFFNQFLNHRLRYRMAVEPPFYDRLKYGASADQLSEFGEREKKRARTREKRIFENISNTSQGFLEKCLSY